MSKRKVFVLITVMLLVVLLTTTILACKKKTDGDKLPPNFVILDPPEDTSEKEPPLPEYDESDPRQNMLDYYGLSETVSLTESYESLSEQAIRLSIINNFFDTLKTSEIPVEKLRAFSKSNLSEIDLFIFDTTPTINIDPSIDIDLNLTLEEFIEISTAYFNSVRKTINDTELFNDAISKGNEYINSINPDNKYLYENYAKMVQLYDLITELKYPFPVSKLRYNQGIQALIDAGLVPGTAESPDGSYNTAYLINVVAVADAALSDARANLDNLLQEDEAVISAKSILETSSVLDKNKGINEPTLSRWRNLFLDETASVNNHTLDWLRTYAYALKDTYPKTKITIPKTTDDITSYWVDYLYKEQLRGIKYYESIAYPYLKYAEAVSLNNKPEISPVKFIFATGAVGVAIESMLPDYLTVMYHKMQREALTQELKALSNVERLTEQDIATYIALQTNYLNAKVELVNNHLPALQSLINGLRELIPNPKFYDMKDYLLTWLAETEKALQIKPVAELTKTIFASIDTDLIANLVTSLAESDTVNRRNFGIFMAKTLTSIKTSLPTVSELTTSLLNYQNNLTGYAKAKMAEKIYEVFSSDSPELEGAKASFDTYQWTLNILEQFVLSDDLSYIEFAYNSINNKIGDQNNKIGDHIISTITNFENRGQINAFYNKVLDYLGTLVDEDADEINAYLKNAIPEITGIIDGFIFADNLMTALASYEPYSNNEETINNVKTTLEQLLNHYIEVGFLDSVNKTSPLEDKEKAALTFLNSFIFPGAKYITNFNNFKTIHKSASYAFLPDSTEQTLVLIPDSTGVIRIVFSHDSIFEGSNASLHYGKPISSYTSTTKEDGHVIIAPIYAGTPYYITFTPSSAGNVTTSFSIVSYDG